MCRCHLISAGELVVGDDVVLPVEVARDLAVYVDGGLTMRSHVNYVVSSAFGALRQIRSM